MAAVKTAIMCCNRESLYLPPQLWRQIEIFVVASPAYGFQFRLFCQPQVRAPSGVVNWERVKQMAMWSSSEIRISLLA
jgi:hypothetical protein